MKRLLISLVAVVIIATPSTVAAQPLTFKSDLGSPFFLNVIEQPKQPTIVIEPVEPEKKEKPKPPKPVVYSVKSGDNLTKIGTKYNVEWQRLWAKNKKLTHPDLIYVGDKITIPEPSERLKRAIPAAVSLPAVTPGVVAAKPVYDGSNTYDYGYCTWYVKNRRGASIPNGLGNANTWYSRAAGMGMAVGSKPRAGAVGTTTRGSLGHVVYVESVNKDGSINISEMNAPTWGAVTNRTAAASEFVYIY